MNEQTCPLEKYIETVEPLLRVREEEGSCEKKRQPAIF